MSGFGGPVWHASVSGRLRPFEDMKRAALEALRGVGDEALGQWEEHSGRAYHVRRRLSDSERKLAGDLLMVDIRGTPEYGVRRAAMQRYLPPQCADWQE